MMDSADAGRASDTDGRGNLSEKALLRFVTWFCEVARDQIAFMASCFDFSGLRARLRAYVLGPLGENEDAAAIVDAIFVRGSVARGDAEGITGRRERTAREVLRRLLRSGLLRSETPKGDIFLHFSSSSADFLFPRLFPPEALS